MRISLSRIAWILLFLVSLLQVSYAQVDTGAISGLVTDPIGAVLAQASVLATNLGTNAQHKVVTDSKGVYSINGLSVGLYTLSIQSSGFKPYTAKLQVTVGSRLAADARLSVNAAVDIVEVSAQGGVAVNTQSPEISQVVDSQQLTQLPSLTRNPYDFVGLSGNVSSGDTTSSGTAQNATTRGVGYNLNGQRSSGTEILLDGLENNQVFDDVVGIKIPIDAVEEYRIVTSNFEPQYGRASGGVVNVVTKAGSNKFHGTVWEFNRLSAYTANTVYASDNDLAKGGYTRNQFGYVVGGPILHDKLFFLNSVEWTRVRSNATVQNAVITPQLLALSSAATRAYYAQYGSNTFSFTKTASAADVGLASSTIPGATPAFGLVSYQAPVDAGGGTPQNTYNVVGRVDYNFGPKTQIFGRYVLENQVEQTGSYGYSPYSQYDAGYTYNGSNYQLNVLHQFTPSITLNNKLGFSRLNPNTTYNHAFEFAPELGLGSTAPLLALNASVGLPGLTATTPYGGPQNAIQWDGDIDWVKGNHSYQAGAQINYLQLNRSFGAYAQATETLGVSRATGLANLVSGTVDTFEAAVDTQGKLPCVKNAYTGALTQAPGCTITTPVGEPNFDRSDRYGDWAGYGQDVWKISPRLTLDYGVRYEFYGVQHNNNANLDSNFYYGSGSNYYQQIANGQVLAAPNSPIHKLWNTSKGDVAPRVGFAYDPVGNGKTSIRGGFGISYERNFGNVTYNVIQNPPSQGVVVLNKISIQTSNLGPLGNSSGTSIELPPTSLRNVDQNIKTAQTQFWSLDVQHEIAHNTIVAAQYLSAHGVHLYDIKNINGLGSGVVGLGESTTDSFGNFGLPRLNQQFSNINNRGSNGGSSYNALNLNFQTTNLRNSGLSASANFTWSHSLDDVSTTFSETNNTFNLGYTNPFKPRYDYGNSDLDIQKRLVFSPVYEEPWFKNSRSLLGEALGGWVLDGIFTARSGSPVNFFDSSNNAGDGYNIPRYTPTSRITQTNFNKAGAYQGGDSYLLGTLPAALNWSNAALGSISNWGPFPLNSIARNSFRGPGAWNLDAALAKKFTIHEQISVELRAEGFDVLNHHNFYVQEASNDVGNYGYGVPIPIFASKGGITNGPNDERRFGQFALKVNF